MMITSADRIERTILLKAPRSRVWRALSNAEEFGNWFGVALKGRTFTAGKRTQGKVTHLIVRGDAGEQKAVRKGASVPTQRK